MPGWIPVSERLPERGLCSRQYVCWNDVRRKYVLAYLGEERLVVPLGFAKPTHWYDGDPLPSPPEEGT